ncbi:MAG: hypothetical protein A2Y86_09015 [Candidatus Aminicenantes bacterium RBG_13_62_12]|nr:MAG: hypothetical protein A2Y86_09015 [Candidatus Aminicenantes bacterium RBG_13_62_12]
MAAAGVLGDVLEVVGQLQERSEPEKEILVGRLQAPGHEVAVGEDGRSALFQADGQDVLGSRGGRHALLEEALDLGVVDRQQGLINAGEIGPRIAAFDELDEVAELLLPRRVRALLRAFEPGLELGDKGELFGFGCPRVVEHVIQIGVDHAVGEYGVRVLDGKPQVELERIHDPNVTEGLVGRGEAQAGAWRQTSSCSLL